MLVKDLSVGKLRFLQINSGYTVAIKWAGPPAIGRKEGLCGSMRKRRVIRLSAIFVTALRARPVSDSSTLLTRPVLIDMDASFTS